MIKTSLCMSGDIEMKKAKTFQTIMLMILIVVGILQFFDTPKILDYILGIAAFVSGLAGFFFMKKP